MNIVSSGTADTYEANIDGFVSLLEEARLPWACFAGFWVVCNEAQEGTVLAAIEAKSHKPVQIIEAALEQGGAALLLRLLEIVNPNLPFGEILEADLEHLVMELHPLFQPAYVTETPFGRIDSGLAQAQSRSRGWWEAFSGTLCVRLTIAPETQALGSAFAALRLAAYCISWAPCRMIVVDHYNFRDSFGNLFMYGGSPPVGYLFAFVILDTGLGTTVSSARRHEMIADAAHFRWVNRGFHGGDAVQDWLDAEAQIDSYLGGRRIVLP